MDEPSVVGSTQLAILPAGAEDGASPLGGNEILLFGDDGFTFLDFLDIINPLQHIPVVSTIYRDLTGDTLDYGSRVAGERFSADRSAPWPRWPTSSSKKPPARTWVNT